jgi:hypothetical protein
MTIRSARSASDSSGDLKRLKQAMTKKARTAGSEPLLLRTPREALERPWAPPAPELHNKGLAVDPEFLLKRLETDPVFAARYWQLIGEPGTPEVSESPDAPGDDGVHDDEENLHDAA